MKILVIAPHPDDEVLGVGGTIAKYSSEGHEVYVCIVTSVGDVEMLKLIRTEAENAHKVLGVKKTFYLDFPVVQLRETPVIQINSKMLEIVEEIKPNIAFLPHKGDMHIDHGEVAKSAMVALRPINNPQLQAIYAYETLSETEWNMPSIDNIFIPNVWIDITNTIDLKFKAMECYKSQLQEFPQPRSIEAIEALSKLRGSTVCVRSAESFMLIRNVF